MNNDAVLQQLDGFVRSTFQVPSDDPDFGNDVHLFDYGYIDSFGAQQLIEHIEATYKIAISNDDLVKFPLNTLNEISKFVAERQAGLK